MVVLLLQLPPCEAVPPLLVLFVLPLQLLFDGDGVAGVGGGVVAGVVGGGAAGPGLLGVDDVGWLAPGDVVLEDTGVDGLCVCDDAAACEPDELAAGSETECELGAAAAP
jgi:hypothetical protein